MVNVRYLLFWLFIGIVVLNCVDLLTTYYGLTYLPIIERNPIMANLSMQGMIIAKFGMIAMLPLFFVVFLRIMDRLAWAHKVIIPVMVSLNIIYILVCVGNIDLIIAWS